MNRLAYEHFLKQKNDQQSQSKLINKMRKESKTLVNHLDNYKSSVVPRNASQNDTRFYTHKAQS